MACLGLKSGNYLKRSAILLALLLLVSCQSEKKAREWRSADSIGVAATVDTTNLWQFDSAQYLADRMEILDAETPTPVTEKVIPEFRKAVNCLVADGLAESFWRELYRNHHVTDVPLAIEMAQSENFLAYMPRVIVRSDSSLYLVRSSIISKRHPPKLEYSRLSEKEFETIMRMLIEKYNLFDMKSRFDGPLSTNPARTVLRASYNGKSTLLLFADDKRPRGEPAGEMSEYLDSLFWRE